MDCTDAKSHLLDEIFSDPDEFGRPDRDGGLDAETSVALAEHLAGCESCSAEMLGLKSFRSEMQIPAIEIPAGMTERIMARVDEAVAQQPPTLGAVAANDNARPAQPWLRSLGPVISKAGAWAMRPQTAMAAVFVLMVGSSAWLLGREHDQALSSSAPAAREQGAPLAAPTTEADFDPEAARIAHGLGGGSPAGRPATPAAPAPMPPSLEASESRARRAAAADDQAPAADGVAKLAAGLHDANKKDSLGDEKSARAAGEEEPAASAPGKGSASGGAFATAMQHYNAKRWDEATAGFDALAHQGDSNAELWAARSVQHGQGCRTALTRFDHLAGSTLGTPAGNEAAMEGGKCYRSLGLLESSTQRFQRLLAYDGWSSRARAELEINKQMMVARREAQAGAAAAAKAKPVEAAPPPAEAAKPASPP